MSAGPHHAGVSPQSVVSSPPLQRTRFQRASHRLAASLMGQLRGEWRQGSAVLLALLLGFYSGGNLTSYVLPVFPGGRPAMVLALVLALEVLVRLRGRMLSGPPGLSWRIADNLRIGLVYAVVLEAYKLGT
jgi:dolichol kinase